MALRTGKILFAQTNYPAAFSQHYYRLPDIIPWEARRLVFASTKVSHIGNFDDDYVESKLPAFTSSMQ